MNKELHHGDCLEVLPTLPENSIDLILTSLPYGISGMHWDVAIDPDKLWAELKRVLKPGGVAVMTGIHPLSARIILANEAMYQYSWIWKRENFAHNLGAVGQPRQDFVDILVFYEDTFQMDGPSDVSAVLEFPEIIRELYHPVEKPVALMEHFITRYSQAGDTVLDPTMGSGTVGVAALKNQRNFVGIEQDPDFFKVAARRIDLGLE